MFKFTIEAQTLPEMRQKLKDILTMHESAQYVVPEVAVKVPAPKAPKVPKPKPAISVEDLQKLCTEVAGKVGMPAVKAMISAYGDGGIKSLTEEQREELANKLSNRHE